jgi:hypothetical protein
MRRLSVLNLDDLFQKDQFDHPKLRYWEALARKHGAAPHVEVFRPRDGFGFAPARLYVIIYDEHGEPAVTDAEPWEPLLMLATVERGWRAPDLDKETIRFGLLLKMFFSQPQMRYGDGYFSSVLVGLLRDSEFAREPAIAELLSSISVLDPGSSPSREPCEENIKAMLARVARLLVENLKYGHDAAKVVLTASLAYFLDERFSVTSRKILGF